MEKLGVRDILQRWRDADSDRRRRTHRAAEPPAYSWQHTKTATGTALMVSKADTH